jgi:site-specific DNA recombinase
MKPEQRLALLSDDDPQSPLAADAAKLRGQIAELLDMWQAGEITRAEHKQRRAILAGQLTRTEQQMSRVSRVPVLHDLFSAADVRKAWEALPLDRQRAVVKELLEVTIQRSARSGTATGTSR